jgi:hypothetical protein
MQLQKALIVRLPSAHRYLPQLRTAASRRSRPVFGAQRCFFIHHFVLFSEADKQSNG